MRKMTLGFVTLLALAGQASGQPTPGVTTNEIVLGTIQDLSGPLSQFGKQISQGLQLRLEEVNEQGGIHGRKLRLQVEDHGYDPKKAVLATQKMVNREPGVFAIIAHFGTPMNIASMPIQFEKNVINFFPVSSAREMYEPNSKLKFANSPTNFDMMRIATFRLMKQHGLTKPCALYQDDDYGLEVVQGAEAGAKLFGKPLIERTSYKRGATDFSSQVARMKAAGCDLVVLGTITRETVGTMSEGRKTGFNPVFVGPNGVYGEIINKLGGKAVEGLYATMMWENPYMDAPDQRVRFWANKYKTKFGEDPQILSVFGYQAMDSFVKAALKAGPRLTTDLFAKTMESMTFERDIFGGAELTFSATRHLGNRYARLSQIRDGRWKVVSDYDEFSGLKRVQQKNGSTTVQSEFFKTD